MPRRVRRLGDEGSDEGGQGAVLVLAVTAALLVVLLVALSDLGAASVDRTRAQTAADAAALAALDGGGVEAAQRLAGANGAVLVAYTAGPGPHEVTVTVRVGDATATARATDAP